MAQPCASALLRDSTWPAVHSSTFGSRTGAPAFRDRLVPSRIAGLSTATNGAQRLLWINQQQPPNACSSPRRRLVDDLSRPAAYFGFKMRGALEQRGGGIHLVNVRPGWVTVYTRLPHDSASLAGRSKDSQSLPRLRAKGPGCSCCFGERSVPAEVPLRFSPDEVLPHARCR